MEAVESHPHNGVLVFGLVIITEHLSWKFIKFGVIPWASRRSYTRPVGFRGSAHCKSEVRLHPCHTSMMLMKTSPVSLMEASGISPPLPPHFPHFPTLSDYCCP